MKRIHASDRRESIQARLKVYGLKNGSGPYLASELAPVLFPDTKFTTTQGAGRAARNMLKRLDLKSVNVGSLVNKQWAWFL